VDAGSTVNGDDTDVADEAVIVTTVAVATLDANTENVALLLPAVIATVAGTDATAVLLLESETTTPPVGA
jgi:hypothetical protein